MRRNALWTVLGLGGAAGMVVLWACVFANGADALKPLPKAPGTGTMPLETVLARRRSVRTFKPAKLTRQQIARLCWAAQGISDAREGFRTAPSAGALYPLELYVVTADGVEHYVPRRHAMRAHLSGDLRRQLQAAALNQEQIGQAAATFVVTAVFRRTERKYGRRANRYVLIEVGHAGQNLLLEATALGLGAVPIGAFEDERVSKILSLPADHAPLYLIPVGVPAT